MGRAVSITFKISAIGSLTVHKTCRDIQSDAEAQQPLHSGRMYEIMHDMNFTDELCRRDISAGAVDQIPPDSHL